MRCVGLGLSDKEVMERLWSYLRRFSRMTKEMRPSHRTDVLSHALLYYGNKTKQKLGMFLLTIVQHKKVCSILLPGTLLLRRWRRAEEMKSIATETYEYLVSSLPGMLNSMLLYYTQQDYRMQLQPM